MYDHYIAFDWAQTNVAVARMTKKSNDIKVFETGPDTGELRCYLKSLKGLKILTIEESTTAQWLYTEFRESVDKLVICNPRRNRLLCEGAKNDRIDASKLVQLLRSDMIKPVFHSSDEFYYMRKLTSGYEDLVKSSVRLKNQRSAILRAQGLKKGEESSLDSSVKFVIEGVDQGIQLHEEQKAMYLNEFSQLRKKHQLISNLCSIPGIAEISAVKIAASVVNGKRFSTKGRFLSYCGLIKLEKISGNRCYGKKNPDYNRRMKSVFKTAAVTNIEKCSENHFNSYYQFLMKEKNYPDFQARHAVARRIAVLTYGVLKSGKKLDQKELICNFKK